MASTGDPPHADNVLKMCCAGAGVASAGYPTAGRASARSRCWAGRRLLRLRRSDRAWSSSSASASDDCGRGARRGPRFLRDRLRRRSCFRSGARRSPSARVFASPSRVAIFARSASPMEFTLAFGSRLLLVEKPARACVLYPFALRLSEHPLPLSTCPAVAGADRAGGRGVQRETRAVPEERACARGREQDVPSGTQWTPARAVEAVGLRRRVPRRQVGARCLPEGGCARQRGLL